MTGRSARTIPTGEQWIEVDHLGRAVAVTSATASAGRGGERQSQVAAAPAAGGHQEATVDRPGDAASQRLVSYRERGSAAARKPAKANPSREVSV